MLSPYFRVPLHGYNGQGWFVHDARSYFVAQPALGFLGLRDFPVSSPQVAAHHCFPDEGSQLRDAATGPPNLGVKQSCLCWLSSQWEDSGQGVLTSERGRLVGMANLKLTAFIFVL